MTEGPPIGRWTGNPSLMVRRYWAATVGSYLAIAAVLILLLAVLVWCASTGFLAVFLFGGLNWLAERLLGLRRARRPELDLLEGAEDPNIAVVEVVMRRGWRVTGVDRGVAWVADGLFHFRGTACYFALAAEDFMFRTRFASFIIEPIHAPEGAAVTVRSLRWKADPALPRPSDYGPRGGGETRADPDLRFWRLVSAVRELWRSRRPSAEPRSLPPFETP